MVVIIAEMCREQVSQRTTCRLLGWHEQVKNPAFRILRLLGARALPPRSTPTLYAPD